MKKSAILLAGLALVLGAGSSFGQDCGPLNLQFLEPAADVDPTDPMYQPQIAELAAHFGIDPALLTWCWTQRVVGTIPGAWLACGGDGIANYNLFGLPSDPFLFGNPGVIISKKGKVYTMAYSLSKYDAEFNWVAFGGVTYYSGGPGKWDGAEGWSTDRPKHYPPSYWVRSNGFLCMPE